MIGRVLAACLGLSVLGASAVQADTAPFDLAGPILDVDVTHLGSTLPIAEVPNLSPGDLVSIKADLPPDQSVHYLLVAAFLRGATNPPPQGWFFRAETWTRKGHDGLKLLVPVDAEQVVVFLAPQTGGDFKTLIGAVRGRPGAFVRASQDLNQASLDRSRLDAFLAAVRHADPTDPDQLRTVSPLLARSLSVKLNTDCFQKMAELQAACLTQGQDTLVLNDGHSTSIAETLTSGAPADLALQLTASPVANFGYSSAYVAAAFDVVRILQSFQTAQYQYIPAIATAQGDQLALVLNAVPSFHNPLSVLVAALPAVAPPQSPPLRPVDPKSQFCAERTDLLLPVEGAPLAYSTHYAHDMVLRVQGRDARTFDLPVKADAEKGGFVVDTSSVDPATLGDAVDGTMHGYWGFQTFDGPSFHLQTAHAAPWRLAPDDAQALVVGRDDTVHLQGQAASCVQSVALQTASGAVQPVTWTPQGLQQLTAVIPLGDAQPGPITLLVRQYGMKDADAIALRAYSEAGHLTSFAYHADDKTGVLKGNRLDEVADLTLGDITFAPGELTSSGGDDVLTMNATAGDGAALTPGQTLTAKASLKDGRTLRLKTTIAPPRPQIALIDRNVQVESTSLSGAITLGSPDELARGSQLTFSVRVAGPTRLNGREAIEVSGADGAPITTLTPSKGLTQEDPQVLLATLDTKLLDASTFGPLRFRLLQDGAYSDWLALGVLVRLPHLHDLRCHDAARSTCELSGDDLFLLDAVSSDRAFQHGVSVPAGFTGQSLELPSARAGHPLYLRLRDDSSVISQATF